MRRTINIISSGMIHAPGVFKWIREAIAPFDKPKAAELLLALGFRAADAVILADPRTKVTMRAGMSESGQECVQIEFDDEGVEEPETKEVSV